MVSRESDTEYCEKDSKHRHDWKLIAARDLNDGLHVQEIWKCNQCHKCKHEYAVYVSGGF